MLDIQIDSCGYSEGFIIRDIRLSIKKGEKICIVGPNGCGKTTLAKAVVGLLEYKGKVTLGGENLKKLSPKNRAKRVAYMGQMNHANFGYTVLETVLLGRYSKNDDIFKQVTKTDKMVAEESLYILNLEHMKDQLITKLSGGELQRVFLARAFTQDPEILVLDEPTNHLDLKLQIELVEELERWAKEKKKTIVAVLHDINLALNFADRVAVMNKGKIKAFDTKSSIIESKVLDKVYDMDIKGYMNGVAEIWSN